MSRLLILGFMCCGIGLGEVIHVSPEGNDANDGTSSRPLATPKGAQKLAREIIRKGLKEPLEIRFGAGFYSLEQALLLGPQDSGTQEFPVTWRALTDQQVIWSGGVSIGGTLTGSYDYIDANNDLQSISRFKWYRSDDGVLDAGDAVITGATGQSYVVQPGDSGRFVFFDVTPVALTGITSSTPVQSAASAQVAPNDPPTATNVSAFGAAEVGTQLTASYTYSDPDGDLEGNEHPALVPQR